MQRDPLTSRLHWYREIGRREFLQTKSVPFRGITWRIARNWKKKGWARLTGMIAKGSLKDESHHVLVRQFRPFLIVSQIQFPLVLGKLTKEPDWPREEKQICKEQYQDREVKPRQLRVVSCHRKKRTKANEWNSYFLKRDKHNFSLETKDLWRNTLPLQILGESSDTLGRITRQQTSERSW